MSKDKRPSLLIREQFESTFLGLTDAERGKLLAALMAYQWHGEPPDNLSDKLSGVFMAMRSFLDDDYYKYLDKCKKNSQNAHKRWGKEQSEE